MNSQIKVDVLAAARKTAVLVDRSQLGLLRFTGQTRLDLINRMSTQAVNGLQPGQGTATVLTTDVGRMIDRIILYADEAAVLTLTGENFNDQIARYLMRFVFFNDDFQIEDVSGETAVFAIYGPQSAQMVRELGLFDESLPLHHWRRGVLGANAVSVHRTDPIYGDGYFVLCAAADKAVVQTLLLAAGLVWADEAAFEFLRVENGRLRLGHEITGDYIPLEAGLWDDVSFSKGCYIGQEIIARMESRGKLAKKLVQLRPSAPVAAGAALRSNGKAAGTITSVAVGPNGPVALGYVRTAVLQAEGVLTVEGETKVDIVP